MKKIILLLCSLIIFNLHAIEVKNNTQAEIGKAHIGAYGFDVAGMDLAVKADDDFYHYANGTWANNNPIPSDKSNVSAFSTLDDLSKQRTKEILEAAQTDPQSKIGMAYTSYLNHASIQAKGLEPIKPWLNEIKSLENKTDYPVLTAHAARAGISNLFRIYVSQDNKDPETYILKIGQSGLGLPDREYYLSNNEKMEAIRIAYIAHLEKMFNLAGESNAAIRAEQLMKFETEIAKTHWTKIDTRDADKTYNKMTIDELGKIAPGFDFAKFFETNGIKTNTVIVAQPTAIVAIAELIAHAPISLLGDAMLIRSLDSFAQVLPEEISQEDFNFYSTVLSGVPQQEDRWKRAISFVKNILPDELSKIYVAKYFDATTKTAIDNLVQNVITAMGNRINKLSWMSAETKARAHKKLAAFTPKIGYPDRWRTYDDLIIQEDDLFGNALRANQFHSDYFINKLGKSIYRWEWGMTPMEINAYANFGMVEIVFPAAILQPPFFDPYADPAVNYGSIGAVIGHELSHHFDDQGAKYDETGNLQQWWTDADITSFKKLTEKLIKQFDVYEPLPGIFIKGAFTLGENIGDLAGLAIAYDAYHASLNGKLAPIINGTTGDQRFFLGWAQVWRRNYREENLVQRLMTDPHAPSQYRANIVRNFDSWYAAFNPEATGTMYLNPEDRVKIW